MSHTDERPPPRYVPPELCELIAAQTHPNDLFNLARVARNFAFFAVPRLWRTRTLDFAGDPGEQEAEAPSYTCEDEIDVAAWDETFYSRPLQRDRTDTVAVRKTGRMPPSIARILSGASGSPRKDRMRPAAPRISPDTPLLFDYPSLLTKLNVRYRRVSEILPLLKSHGHQLRYLDMRGIVFGNREQLVAGSPECPFTHLSTVLEYLDISRVWVLRTKTGSTKAKRKSKTASDELAQSLRRAGWVDPFVGCLRKLKDAAAPPEWDPAGIGTLETRKKLGTPGLKVLCMGNAIDDTSKLRAVLDSFKDTLQGLCVDALALNATMGLAGAARRESVGIELCRILRWIVIENHDRKVDVYGALFKTSKAKGESSDPPNPELKALFLVNANLTALRLLQNYDFENPPTGIQTLHVTGDLARLGSEPGYDFSLLSRFPWLRQFGLECSSRAVLHQEDFRLAVGSSIMQCPLLETFSLIGLGSNREIEDGVVVQLLRSLQTPCLKSLLLPFADRFYATNRIEFGRNCFELAIERWGSSLEKIAIGVPAGHDKFALEELAGYLSRFERLRDVEIWGLGQVEFARLKGLFLFDGKRHGVGKDWWRWQVVFERRRGISGHRWAESEMPSFVRLGTRTAVRELRRIGN